MAGGYVVDPTTAKGAMTAYIDSSHASDALAYGMAQPFI